MTGPSVDVEQLLGRALAPIEPPAHLAERLENTLADIAAIAAEELEAWELRSLHDPRTWARPVAAVEIGRASCRERV